MKNTKTHKLVMLPTEKAPLTIYNNCLRSSKYSDFEIDGVFIPQHLYILSDEEIKVGDWYIDFSLKLDTGFVPTVSA